MHSHRARKAIVAAAHDVLVTRGLPDDIISVIVGTFPYAANIIRCFAVGMMTVQRDIRMSIRWFRLNGGSPDPVFMCNHGWHWIDNTDLHMSLDDEFHINETWNRAGRPVPPYIQRQVSVAMVQTSRKRRIHYSELHALQRATGRARRILPHWWGV